MYIIDERPFSPCVFAVLGFDSWYTCSCRLLFMLVWLRLILQTTRGQGKPISHSWNTIYYNFNFNINESFNICNYLWVIC